MNRRLYSLFVLLLVILFSLAFLTLSPGVKASADTVWRQMTIQETYDFYGDSIDCIYYSTSGYKHVTLTKSSNMYTWEFGTIDDFGQPSWINSNYWAGYFATVNDFSNNPSYMQFNISPNVHFSDCTSVRVAAAAHSPTSVSSSVYSPSICKLNDGTGDLIYSTSGFTYNGSYPVGRMHRNSYFDCMPVWAEYDSNVITDVNVLQFGFSGANVTNSGGIEIYLMAPFINDGATPGTGTVVPGTTTTTSAGSSGDVNLTETNGLISSVISAITNLPNTIMQGLRSLFVPDDDFMDDFKDDMQDLLEDHLGGLYEAVTLLTDMFDDLPSVTAKQSIYIPPCHIPLAGTDFVLGDWTVPLKVSGLPNIFYEGIAFITDFLATMAFLNMCRRKLEIFLNPDSEVIQS